MEKTISQKRQKEIMEILNTSGDVKVAELSVLFKTSQLTIRRDLDFLEKQDLLVKYYGGARLAASADNGNNTLLYKQAIARYAASMVEDGDAIFINTSSTAVLILNYITAKNVTVITNNGNVFHANITAQNLSIVLTGGELRFPKSSMTGEFALNNIKRVTGDKCFLGCAGITSSEGITTNILPEASINETMLTRTSGPKIIVADHTKIGIHQNFLSGSTSMVDCLITDAEADDTELEKFREKSIKCIKVSQCS